MDEVLAPVFGVSAIVAVIAFSAIVVRFANAFAKRLEDRPSAAAPPDPAIGELRAELDALQERLDFLERALIAQKDQSGRALPAKGERADSTGHATS